MSRILQILDPKPPPPLPVKLPSTSFSSLPHFSIAGDAFGLKPYDREVLFPRASRATVRRERFRSGSLIYRHCYSVCPLPSIKNVRTRHTEPLSLPIYCSDCRQYRTAVLEDGYRWLCQLPDSTGWLIGPRKSCDILFSLSLNLARQQLPKQPLELCK